MSTTAVSTIAMGRCANFPCCCDMPLEIAVQFLTVFDLFYSTTCLVGYIAVFAVDLFAHRKTGANNATSEYEDDANHFRPPDRGKRTLPPFVEKTTKSIKPHVRPPFTLRPIPTLKPYYDYDTADTYKLSKGYSKISTITLPHHDYIEKKCGRDYIANYLFTYQLDKTIGLFEQLLYVAIAAQVLYIARCICMLTTVCCFIEHKSSKMLVIFLWWFNWVPMFLTVHAMILSQSHRICILQYAWEKKGFRGQTFMFWFLIWPLISYKPYELLLLGFYIKDFFAGFGFILDESLVPVQLRGESEGHKTYFKEFYKLESERGRNIHDDEDNYSRSGYEDYSPSEVDDIQSTARQTDPYFQRKQEIARINYSGALHRDKLKSIRKS